MKKIGKKTIIITAMLVLLGGAVYANWALSGGDLTLAQLVNGTSSERKMLGQAELTGATVGDATDVQTDKNDVLTELRLDRTQERDRSVAALQSVTENAALTEDERRSAVETLSDLTRRMEAENDIETLVRAKGYADCIASVTKESVTVTVRGDARLTPAAAAQIKDIAISATNCTPEMIKIVEVG